MENSTTPPPMMVVLFSAVGVPPLASVCRACTAASMWRRNSRSSISWMSFTEFSSMIFVMGIS